MTASAPDSEKIVLSCALQWPDEMFPRILGEGIGADHFANPSNQFLWSWVEALHRRGDDARINLIHLTEDLKSNGHLGEWFNGPHQLAEIFTFAPTDAHLTHAIQKVILARGKRIAGKRADRLRDLVDDPDASSEELENLLREAVEEVTGALASTSSSKDAKTAGDEFVKSFQRLMEAGSIPGTPTGIECLDAITGGMKPGELWTIAGHTSRGKSVLMLQAAGNAAKAGKSVLVFSLEMTADQVVPRILAGVFNAPFSIMMNPHGMTQGEKEAIGEAFRQFVDLKIKVNDQAEMTADRIAAEIGRIADREPLDVVVVDYLQLVDGDRKRNERADEELSRVQKRLKQLAKKHSCAVITASQLSDDGKLFGSRAIGHHSDVVLLIQDEGVKVNKNRNARRGDVLPIVLAGHKQRFERR